MTTRLEIPSYTTDRLAEIFESYIPVNKYLGLRCLGIGIVPGLQIYTFSIDHSSKV